ncbi:phage Gp37/Gp68 family protein [Microbaculum marinisediminis]|uniref:Phage Gp37/Gp68 family protein n=1 Tax=Microbaculum marinisediminis TaxID=2931392 RepID=A0AAW5QSH0_9HYPH|nr:phage Gp37/Gp68 family protein [Microbaculum sp. A6E488]MCT8970608.1 phage Gp37/Gp68 family protein [Microbaculum sp. A6E488]
MAEHSTIEWTDATWNPVTGCSVVSPGCTNCYAMRMAARLEAMAPRPDGTGDPHLLHYAGTTQDSRAGPVWTGKVALAPEAVLAKPLRRRKPTMYFVNSMGDLFHEAVPDDWIDRVFAVMALAPQHTFQVLTKRSARMRDYMAPHCLRRADGLGKAVIKLGYDGPLECLPSWPLPNVWLGVSAEDQTRADERIPDLLATPAAVRFVSAEPLLGPVDLTMIPTGGRIGDAVLCDDALSGPPDFQSGSRLDWVIVGGESGRGARPMHPAWARSLRDQCQAAGVPFFLKQWGEWAPGECAAGPPTRTETGAWWFGNSWRFGRVTPRESEEMHCDDAPDVYRLGKKAAGALLDGREWREMPAATTAGGVDG